MKTYYHGSEYPIKELRNQPMFFTDSEEFAKSLEWNGLENEKCNRYVYSAELEYTKPFIITSEEEYEERMMDMPCFENDEDALIYPAEGRTPEYLVVKDAAKQVKNFKLVKHVYEDRQKPIKAYHSGNLEKGIHAGHLFFTDDRETAELYGKENGGSKTYLCELTFKNPIVMTDVEYDEFMQNMTDWNEPIKQGYDSIISPEEGGATYYIALKPEEQVKIKKTMDINESLEKYDDFYATNSEYEFLAFIKRAKTGYRVLYDKKNKYYFMAEATSCVHPDLLKKAVQNGYYPELTITTYWDYFLTELGMSLIDFLFFPLNMDNKQLTQDRVSDGHTYKYTYDFGIFWVHYTSSLEPCSVYDLIGEPKEFEKIFPEGFGESLNEHLEKMGDCFCTTSAYDIVNLLKNKPKEYRILYDAKIGYYLIGEAEHFIHHQLMEKAFDEGLYYPVKDFMQNMCGGFDKYSLYSYQDLGIDGYYDGEDDENFDAYLYYIVFSPNEEWELGTDGYDKRYDYPFGHVFTRGCDFSEIGLWDALGVPQNSEKLNESVDNLNDAFWKWFGNSKLIENGKPMVFYHGTNKNFDKFSYKKTNDTSVLGKGFYFTADEDIAKTYLGGLYGKPNKNSHVIQVYLKMENPLYADEQVDEKVFQLITDCVKNHLECFWTKAIPVPDDSYIDEGILDHLNINDILKWKKYAYGKKNNSTNATITYLSKGNSLLITDILYLFTNGYNQIRMTQYIQDAIRTLYDGVIFTSYEGLTYLVFNANQIKAVDNKGTWSDSDNIYEHLNEEEYKYVDNVEVLKLSPSDDMKVYRNFAKDFTNLRALIKGEDIYLWDAKQATHDQIADGLFGEDSELDNQFMFDTKYKELDDYSIRNTIDMYKFDKGTALGEKWYNDFFKYYEIIKNRLGVDFTKEGLEKVEYLKSLKTSNIYETLNREIERYL